MIRVAGVAEDMTQRQQTEAALRESEARKSAIMESALDAIIKALKFAYADCLISLAKPDLNFEMAWAPTIENSQPACGSFL